MVKTILTNSLSCLKPLPPITLNVKLIIFSELGHIIAQCCTLHLLQNKILETHLILLSSCIVLHCKEAHSSLNLSTESHLGCSKFCPIMDNAVI